MKIRIKKNLLNESKLDSYSNVWKSWKTIDDFHEWNRSQVLALAKHRKGQGKFNFKFYDKVYEDLKYFIENSSNYSYLDHPSNVKEKAPNNIFFMLYMRDSDLPKRIKKKMPGHISSYYLVKKGAIKITKEIASKNNLDSDWTVLEPKEPYRIWKDGYYIAVGDYPYDEEWVEGWYMYYPDWLRTPNVETLKKHLKNMESLRETYPWNKKHLPTIQKYLGIYEKKIKKH